MAFRRKKDRILQYDPDVVIVQECENPDEKGDWHEFSDWAWIGENEHKGLGVFSRNDITVQSLHNEDAICRYVLPVKLDVDGVRELLAVWAMNEKGEPRRRYIGQVYTALQQYSDYVNPRSIVAGDFNWNAVWDESPDSSLYGDFSDTAEVLNKRGLCSAYHSLNRHEYGVETDPTFFMHKKQDNKYHIDYIFLPYEKLDSVTDFSIGPYEKWIESSDHVPISIEIED